MPTAVKLIIDGLELLGELGDSAAGRALAERLPLAWNASRWGREYYGSFDKAIPPLEGQSRSEMAVGELAFHSASGWFCLFFGPTPASRGEEPRAAFPVLPVGRVTGDWEALAALGEAVEGRLEAV